MDKQRPWMRRFHRNASVLILTCLIQRADGSQMNSLISTIEYIRFYPLEKCSNPLSFFLCCLCSCLCVLALCLPIEENRRGCNREKGVVIYSRYGSSIRVQLCVSYTHQDLNLHRSRTSWSLCFFCQFRTGAPRSLGFPFLNLNITV
jgi:hypothetical protein